MSPYLLGLWVGRIAVSAFIIFMVYNYFKAKKR